MPFFRKQKIEKEFTALDKYEYKIRSEEIRNLIAEGNYSQAAEIADTIDWRRVKSVMMLCTISDLYKINKRYEDARDMLLLAYDKRPGGRTICYSLCELCLKTEDYVQAVEYYKEFVQVAPRDPGRYILQYKIYETQDVSLEERIEVLKELKQADYREKWAYELAYLYHRVGLANHCVEECDELILWFGTGRYVIKAMELKMLHEPLTPDQQYAYEHRFEPRVEETLQQTEEETVQESPASETVTQVTTVMPQVSEETRIFNPMDVENALTEQKPAEEEMEIKVAVGTYDTINLQAELAAGLKEVLEAGEPKEASEVEMAPDATIMWGAVREQNSGEMGDTVIYPAIKTSDNTIEKKPVEETVERHTATVAVEPQLDDQATRVMEPIVIDRREEIKEAPAVEEQHTRVIEPIVFHHEAPKNMANVLSQESDGQIRMVVPEQNPLERQITGQMNIEDILAEWERMKKENREQHEEEIRQHVLQQTGQMFTAFEASIRDGILGQLENDEMESEEKASEEDAQQTEEEFYEEVSGDLNQAAQEYSEDSEEYTEGDEEYVEEGSEEYAEGDEEYVEEGSEEYAEGEEEYVEEGSEEYAEGEEEYVEEGSEEYAEGDEEYVEESSEEYAEGNEEYVEEDAEEYTESEEEADDSSEDEVEELEEIQDTEESETAEEFEEETSEENDEEVFEEEPEEESESTEPEETFEETPEAEEVPEDSSKEDVVDSEEETTDEEKEEEDSKPATEEDTVESATSKLREFTKEEKDLYAPYIYTKSAKEQLLNALENTSMASYTGNLIITGEEGLDILGLAKSVASELQNNDGNFTGKVAKISAQTLNRKEIPSVLEQVKDGALIVEHVSDLTEETVKNIDKWIQQENQGIELIILDTKKKMKKFLDSNPEFATGFTARIDLEALSDDALVKIAKQYARSKEFSIDNFGILALHTRIDELQTSDHVVTVSDVKAIIDEAIHHVKKKSIGHFIDVLVGKRYDDEDMIILSEKDFS